MHRCSGRRFATLSLALAVWVLVGLSASNAHAGRSKIRPFFSFRAAYNTNVLGIDSHYTTLPTLGTAYEKKTKPLKAFHLSYSPGLSFMYVSGRSTISAQYKLSFEQYFAHGDLPADVTKDEVKDLGGIGMQGHLRLAREWERLTLSLEDNLLWSRRLENIYNNTDRTEAYDFISNQLMPNLEFRWNHRHSTLLKYRWDLLYFIDDGTGGGTQDIDSDPQDNNSEGHYAFVTHEYKPDAINTFTLQYIFHARSFHKTTDFLSHSPSLRYERQLPKYRLGGSLGFQHTEFELECIDRSKGGGPCDINNRHNQTAEHPDQATMVGEVFFRANRNQRLHWEVIGERGRNTFGTNSFFTFNRVDTRAVYQFTPRVAMSAAFTLVNNRYDNEPSDFDEWFGRPEADPSDPNYYAGEHSRRRKDWLYRTIVSVDYMPKPWLTVSLEYDYRKRDSNQAAADLRNHIGYLELRIYPVELTEERR